MVEIEKIESYNDVDDTWEKESWALFRNKYRFTFKNESKLAIQKEIEELESKINELKKLL